MPKKIITQRNGTRHVLFFDEVDRDFVESHCWHVWAHSSRRKKYAMTRIDGKTRKLHRLLLGEPDGVIDHINGNGLDNRRDNLRVTTAVANGWNRQGKANKNNRSGYLGVQAHGSGWRCRAGAGGKTRLKGIFKTPLAAFRALQKWKREQGLT